jgi:plastocyanin
VVLIRQGDPLNYTNLDTVTHNVVSDTGLFQSSTVGLGTTTAVNGVNTLSPGTYQFHCSLHPWMTGQLIVK